MFEFLIGVLVGCLLRYVAPHRLTYVARGPMMPFPSKHFELSTTTEDERVASFPESGSYSTCEAVVIVSPDTEDDMFSDDVGARLDDKRYDLCVSMSFGDVDYYKCGSTMPFYAHSVLKGAEIAMVKLRNSDHFTDAYVAEMCVTTHETVTEYMTGADRLMAIQYRQTKLIDESADKLYMVMIAWVNELTKIVAINKQFITTTTMKDAIDIAYDADPYTDIENWRRIGGRGITVAKMAAAKPFSRHTTEVFTACTSPHCGLADIK